MSDMPHLNKIQQQLIKIINAAIVIEGVIGDLDETNKMVVEGWLEQVRKSTTTIEKEMGRYYRHYTAADIEILPAEEYTVGITTRTVRATCIHEQFTLLSDEGITISEYDGGWIVYDGDTAAAWIVALDNFDGTYHHV